MTDTYNTYDIYFYSGTLSNGTCVVNCDDGFYTTGNPATCFGGVWMEPLPACIEETCSHLPFSNVNRTASDCNGTTSQSTCEVVCNEGYTASQNHTTCVRGGWTGNVYCEPNSCTDDLPSIAMMDRNASQVTCNGIASNSTCEISCQTGYRSTGSLECSLGLWVESTIPTCNLDCSSNPPIRFLNNTATLCQNTPSGSTCENVTCLRSPSAYYSRPEGFDANEEVANLINDAIPNRHNIVWDSGRSNSISDGGNDMYDNGNFLNWNGAALPYKYGTSFPSGVIEVVNENFESGNNNYLRADYVYDGSGFSGFGTRCSSASFRARARMSIVSFFTHFLISRNTL